MFKISPELKNELKETFNQITAKTNELTFQNVLPAHAKKLKQIAELCAKAHATLHKARKEQNGRDPESKALLTQLAVMHNTAESLREMASIGDASSEMVSPFKQEIASHIKKFGKLAKELEAANAGKEQRREQYAGLSPEEANSEEKRIQRENEEKEALELYNRYATKMPAQDARAMGSKKLVLFDIPVIPLIDVPVSSDQLKKAGFNSHAMGMYNVLEKQRIVGLNPLALKAERIDPEDFLSQVLKNIGERSGGRWMAVSDEPTTYKSRGLLFYWVMESGKLTRLLKLTRGPIEAWGFPFAVDHKKLTHAPFQPKQSEVKVDDKKTVTVRDGVPRWHGLPKTITR